MLIRGGREMKGVYWIKKTKRECWLRNKRGEGRKKCACLGRKERRETMNNVLIKEKVSVSLLVG